MLGLATTSAQAGVGPSSLRGLPILTSTQKTGKATPEHNSPEARSLRKSTQEFEAMLVSSWWQEMQNSFHDPDEEQEAGSDTLQQIAFQSMATAMAALGRNRAGPNGVPLSYAVSGAQQAPERYN